MIIRKQKIRFGPDRAPLPRKVRIGFEGDNMVERLEFDLPEIAGMQAATLMMGGKYANAVTLNHDGEDYYVDLTADLVGAEGVTDAYVRIDGEGGEVWQSDVLRLVTGDVPDVETEIETRFPTAVEQMLEAIAGHKAEMEQQAQEIEESARVAETNAGKAENSRYAAEEAARQAEEAAKRAENAEGGGIVNETDPTVPEWAKQPEKPTYTAEEVGAQPKGDYALKDALPEAVEDALSQAKASGEFDGAQGPKGEKGDKGDPGADGVSATHSWNGTVLAVTSASGTSSADLKGEKGDTGAKGEQGEPGEKGDTGADGADGKDGYTPVRGVDYWTEEDQEAITEEARNQLSVEIASDEYKKAMAEFVPIVKVADTPVFVDSVDDMTDTDKPYVLTTDGMIYTHGESTQTVITEAQNRFDPSAASISARLSGSSGSVSGTAGLGGFVTDSLPVSNYSANDPFNVELNFEAVLSADNKFCLYDSSKALIQGTVFSSGLVFYPNVTVGDGKTIINIRKDNSGNTMTYTNVAYVRIQVYMRNDGSGGTASTALTADEIADVTIKYQHESSETTETTEGFYSTGIAYNQPADYEDRVIELEKDTANNTGNIALLQKRVSNLESGETETAIPDFWEEAVSECIAKIKALQMGRNCITFPFFSDNHQRLGYSGVLIERVMEECHIPYCFYGGDSISSGYIDSEETMIAQDKAFDDMMQTVPNGRFCRTVGNHDGYWAVSADEKYTYTREQMYELFLREESIAQNKRFGDDGTYYYVDYVAGKVRFIVLNTNGGSVDAAQLAWMQDTALSFDERGWAVVFVSHQPISNHYHANISNAAEVIAAVTASDADIIGWFSGHIHRDRIYTGAATNTTDDAQGEAMGFTQITITSDHTGIAYDDVTKHAVSNDDQSHAIDFVTINKGTRTVNITRLGIGSDRSFTY